MKFSNKHNLASFSIALLFLISLPITHACTNILVKYAKSNYLVGRTLEFAQNLNSNITVSPRGRDFSDTLPNEDKAKSWKSKYGYVFLDFFGAPHPVDGVNEKGLSFGYLYLPGLTTYQSVPDNSAQNAVSYLQLGDYILGNFSTVDEVKEAMSDIYVYAKEMDVEGTPTVFPLHAVITDRSGKSITIEFIKGKQKIYDNPQGLLTNTPEFPWQLTNQQNYINLTPYSPKTITLGGVQYNVTGQGAGSLGLPGDYTPPSRFIKMSYLVNTSYPTENSLEALNLAQHILNNVDIPKGAVRGEKNSNDDYDYTQWTVFKDLTTSTFYFKSYSNPNLQKIDLNKLDFSEGAEIVKMPVNSIANYPDVSGNLKPQID